MVNFERITACGECCDDCAKKRDGLCGGCIELDGLVPEWKDSGRCPVYACAKAHGVRFCGICAEFPCAPLTALIHWNPNIVDAMRELARAYGQGISL